MRHCEVCDFDCHSNLYHKIELMLVKIERVRKGTILTVLTKSNKVITQKQKYYDVLEVDEFC